MHQTHRPIRDAKNAEYMSSRDGAVSRNVGLLVERSRVRNWGKVLFLAWLYSNPFRFHKMFNISGNSRILEGDRYNL